SGGPRPGRPSGVRRAANVMKVKVPQIVALGGGGFSMERGGGALDDYVLSLTGAARPRVCFLPTASGDADHYVVRFYRRFSASCDASHVSLFRRDQGTGGVEDDLATHLLAQDLIYVGGGNVVSMLGAWAAHTSAPERPSPRRKTLPPTSPPAPSAHDAASAKRLPSPPAPSSPGARSHQTRSGHEPHARGRGRAPCHLRHGRRRLHDGADEPPARRVRPRPRSRKGRRRRAAGAARPVSSHRLG